MSRINLLTIHYGENKGAFLQSWATKKILESLGHRVTIIDLYNPQISVFSRLTSLNRLTTLPNMLDFMRLRKKHLSPMTHPMTHLIPEYIPEADYTVVGSDQTWNPDITQKNFLSYFLDFVPESGRRIALASSFGVSEWTKLPSSMTESIAAEMKKFKAISVRESSGIDICREHFGISGAEQICDPTIAWGDFSELSGRIPDYPEIFAFIFKKSPFVHAVLGEARRQLKLPVRIIGKSFFSLHSHPEMKPYSCISFTGAVSLTQFLRRISGSRFVVTDSFHATVFCLLNRKSFLVIGPEKENDRFGRLSALLRYFGLAERIVCSPEDLAARREQLFKPVFYDETFEMRLKAMREKYLEFVRRNID